MRRRESDSTDARHRRRFLQLLGALGVTGLAGCGGDDGGTETEEPTDTPGDGMSTASPSPTPTSTPTPTQAPQEPEFVSLFDAESIEDSYWHQINGTATYEVRDGGVITGISNSDSPNSFLSTYEMFDEFVLEFEAWVDPDGLNSGIQIISNSSQTDQHAHGPQVELELSGDSAPQIPPGQSGYVYGEALSTGWMSGGGSNPSAHDAFTNGEWNDFEIRVEGDRIQTFINDEQIEDLDLTQFDGVDHLLPMGFVALQVHSIGADGREVRWRNVRIKELDVQEWERPFNGQNTDGWTKPLDAGDATVSDGELHLSGDDAFFLLTEASYDDFVFETWVNADVKGGVLFRNPGAEQLSGYRAEIDPTGDALSGSLRAADEQDWLKSVEGEDHAQMAYKPDGWNYLRVAAAGENIRVWVNGITTADLTDGAESSGRIGLQHRGGDGTIRFRDLEVKPLEENVLN